MLSASKAATTGLGTEQEETSVAGRPQINQPRDHANTTYACCIQDCNQVCEALTGTGNHGALVGGLQERGHDPLPRPEVVLHALQHTEPEAGLSVHPDRELRIRDNHSHSTHTR